MGNIGKGLLAFLLTLALLGLFGIALVVCMIALIA